MGGEKGTKKEPRRDAPGSKLTLSVYHLRAPFVQVEHRITVGVLHGYRHPARVVVLQLTIP
jgi:hypothetical protein